MTTGGVKKALYKRDVRQNVGHNQPNREAQDKMRQYAQQRFLLSFLRGVRHLHSVNMSNLQDLQQNLRKNPINFRDRETIKKGRY